MSFRKRESIVYSAGSAVVDVETNENGQRSLVSMSTEEYLRKNPPPTEEFSLTEELRAGVPLKEIPCGNLIGSNDPVDNPVDEQKVLQDIQEKLNPDTEK